MRRFCRLAIIVMIELLYGMAAKGIGVSLQGKRPNLIMLVTDDQGWADLGCQQLRDRPIETPNIDRLAERGIRLTDGYACAPICSPSRAGMLMGCYPQYEGYYDNWDSQCGLQPQHVLAPEYLKPMGYRTAAIGKWHLGWEPHNSPLAKGFDWHYGFSAGQHDYFHSDVGHTWYGTSHGINIIEKNGVRQPVHTDRYMTDILTDSTLEFIDECGDQPFFIYLAYTAVHGPHQVLEEDLRRYAGRTDMDDNRKVVRAMIDCLDRNVGRILDRLEQKGMLDNTFITYCGDNGGLAEKAGCDNGPLRGSKGYYSDGGIRVPFLFSWPAGLPEGRVYEEPVINVDILPTMLVAAGADPSLIKRLDGVDLAPYFRGEKSGRPRETLHWQINETPGKRWAVREGDWKLVEARDVQGLFNLADDIGETQDLTEQYPEVAQRLREAHDAWNTRLKPSYTVGAGRKVGQAELFFKKDMKTWDRTTPYAKTILREIEEGSR